MPRIKTQAFKKVVQKNRMVNEKGSCKKVSKKIWNKMTHDKKRRMKLWNRVLVIKIVHYLKK